MSNQVIKTFSRKSGKTISYIESVWKDLKDEYGNDYEKIVGTLKKILKIDENKIEEIVKYIAESKGTYVSVKVQNHEELSKWFQDQGLKTIQSNEMHCTIAYSKKEFKHKIIKDNIIVNDFLEISPLGDDGCLVLKFKSAELQERFKNCMDEEQCMIGKITYHIQLLL